MLSWSITFLIIAIIAAAYGFYLLLGAEQDLANLGIVAFVATLQFLPGVLSVLYWPTANRRGFIAGLLAGTVRILDAVAWADCEKLVREVVHEIVRPYGVTAHLFIQSISQLDEVYTPNIASTIVDNCGASVWFAAAEEPEAAKFHSELLWRDFAWHRLYHLPNLATENVREKFDRFDWSWDDPRLKDWQAGTTGIPLVDAGMRELWATGYMHNRVRMVVGSFLTKNLGIHWRLGEEWFWDTLVDADAASNPFNWQWVAGCGDDAAPFFRIFNPETQAQRFDPDGEYVRRWAPALSAPPIVDLKESRQAALDAYAEIKD